jgi:hypothetical protein
MISDEARDRAGRPLAAAILLVIVVTTVVLLAIALLPQEQADVARLAASILAPIGEAILIAATIWSFWRLNAAGRPPA